MWQLLPVLLFSRKPITSYITHCNMTRQSGLIGGSAVRDVSHPYRRVMWTCGGDVTLTHDNQLIDFSLLDQLF